jgi:serine/arginine repetitive matrix protein 1
LNQDSRFSDKEKKLLKQMKFSDILSKKVDMTKVKVDTMRSWIVSRIQELLGFSDDVVEEYVVSQLEAEKFPDAKKMQ